MTRTFKQQLFTWALSVGAGLLSVAQVAAVRADESSSTLYEDDAWCDVTEWFDGNDYNPTDERWFRWDNEAYNPVAAANSTDSDSDYTGYGYTSQTELISFD